MILPYRRLVFSPELLILNFIGNSFLLEKVGGRMCTLFLIRPQVQELGYRFILIIDTWHTHHWPLHSLILSNWLLVIAKFATASTSSQTKVFLEVCFSTRHVMGKHSWEAWWVCADSGRSWTVCTATWAPLSPVRGRGELALGYDSAGEGRARPPTEILWEPHMQVTCIILRFLVAALKNKQVTLV